MVASVISFPEVVVVDVMLPVVFGDAEVVIGIVHGSAGDDVVGVYG